MPGSDCDPVGSVLPSVNARRAPTTAEQNVVFRLVHAHAGNSIYGRKMVNAGIGKDCRVNVLFFLDLAACGCPV